MGLLGVAGGRGIGGRSLAQGASRPPPPELGQTRHCWETSTPLASSQSGRDAAEDGRSGSRARIRADEQSPEQMVRADCTLPHGVSKRHCRLLAASSPPLSRHCVPSICVPLCTPGDGWDSSKHRDDWEYHQGQAVQGPNLLLPHQHGDRQYRGVSLCTSDLTHHPPRAELGLWILPLLLPAYASGRFLTHTCTSLWASIPLGIMQNNKDRY